eukprot:COSAG05_NODE_3955_length_1752_cov_8.110708_2_plen_146_part_00
MIPPAIDLVVERLELALSLGNNQNATQPAMVIITGDFNVGPEYEMLDKIYAAGMEHAFNPNRTAGLRMCLSPPPNECTAAGGHFYHTTRPMMDGTEPHSRNVMTVDHVFYTPQTLELVSAQSIWDTDHLSDHLAVKTEFRIRSTV